MKNINPSQTAAWKALQQHFEQMKDVTISSLFAEDDQRFSKFSATFDDQMLVDFSKNRITSETMEKLQALAKETDLAGAIKSMFSGEKINRSLEQTQSSVVVVTADHGHLLEDGTTQVPGGESDRWRLGRTAASPPAHHERYFVIARKRSS